MKRFFAILLGAAAATLTASGAAHATIISGSAANEVFDVFGGTAPNYSNSLTTFSSSKLNGNLNGKSVNLTASGGSINASLSGAAATVGGGVTIGGGALTMTTGFGGTSSATFTLSQPAHYFGFDFSVGNFVSGETVSFFGAAGQLLGTLSASLLEKDGSKINSSTYFANITSNLPIDSVVFNTTGVGGKFVIDNVSVSAVPVPAALPLFGAAIAGLGAMGKRRRKVMAKA